jgi:nitrite reductase/ring-hydroxylating ferredoxin subunit
MPDAEWTDVGSVEELKLKPLQEISAGKTTIALSHKDGSFAAISGVCNHVGGGVGRRAARRRLCRLSLALLEVPSSNRSWGIRI